MENKTNIIKALLAFQSECPAVIKESTNPFFKSKYADLATIWETVQPVLAKHGLAVTQLIANDNKLVTVLLHTSGEDFTSFYPIVAKEQNNPQAFGAAVTYARRYALSAILSLVTDDDDDGETAMQRKNPIVDKQKELIKLLKDEVKLAQEIKTQLGIKHTVAEMTEKELDMMIAEAKKVGGVNNG